MILARATEAERRGLCRVLGLSEPSRKRAKYGNKRVITAEGKFDSQGEYAHFLKLKARQERGEISNLTVHPRYELRAWPLHIEDGPVRICTIIPDFEFIENGVLRTQDFKGCVTQEWKTKAKIFAANYGREIQVVKK